MKFVLLFLIMLLLVVSVVSAYPSPSYEYNFNGDFINFYNRSTDLTSFGTYDFVADSPYSNLSVKFINNSGAYSFNVSKSWKNITVAFWYKNETVVTTNTSSTLALWSQKESASYGTPNAYISNETLVVQYMDGNSYNETRYKYPKDGKWHYIAFSMTHGYNTSIYLDGIFVNSTLESSGSMGNMDSKMYINSHSGDITNSGSFAKYDVWLDKTLNHNEISELYNETTGNLAFMLYNCSSGTFTLNATIYNENVPSEKINSSMEAVFTFSIFYSNVSYLNFTDNFNINGSNPYAFCTQNNAEFMNGSVYFKFTSGFTHRHYINNISLTNITQYANLYNFKDTTGVSQLKITVRDQNSYQPLSDITTALLRNYVGEGVWRVVQMDKTDNYGTSVFHIIEQSQDYKISLYDKNGNLLKQTDSMKFLCTSGLCEITMTTLEYASTTAEPQPGTSITFNNLTNMAVVSWSDSSGITQTVRSIYSKETAAGTLIICDNTTTASMGYINCNLTNYPGEVLVQVIVNGEPQLAKWLKVGHSGLNQVVGDTEGAVWTAGGVMVAIGFGLWNPIAAVISVVFILIAFGYLGIFSALTATTVMTFAVLSAVIGLVVKK
jgi:hypothetical protein